MTAFHITIMLEGKGNPYRSRSKVFRAFALPFLESFLYLFRFKRERRGTSSLRHAF